MIVDTTLTLMTLSMVLDVPDEVTIHHALHNLQLLAAYQAGTRGDAEALVRLLTVPRGAPPTEPPAEPPRPAPIPREARTPAQAVRDAQGHAADVLKVAGAMVEPFTSSEVSEVLGDAVSSVRVGMVLGRARWPRRRGPRTATTIWVPRSAVQKSGS